MFAGPPPDCTLALRSLLQSFGHYLPPPSATSYQGLHMNHRLSVAPLFAAIALAACSTDVAVAPRKTVQAPSFLVSVGQKAKHVVTLSGNRIPVGFEARVHALGGTVTSSHAGAGYAVVSGLRDDAAAELAASGFGDVQPDFAVSLDVPAAAIRADASDVDAPSTDSQDAPATAARFNRQWNMRAINAPAAWTANKLGSPTVTVAILDTGIDYDLPDLNGLVDLSRSKSFMDTFVGQSDDPRTPDVDESDPIVPADDEILKFGVFAGRHPITDFNGHGTNVATMVSSKAVRYAGVTSKTTLIGVKVLGANGSGSFSDILNGVLFAADKGADVANMSLGGGFSKSGNGQAVSTINRVFNYARQKGMVIVVSAGNSGIDLKHNGNVYSSYCDAPHVICVSAVGPIAGTTTVDNPLGTTDPDAPAFFTNFGKNNVDVAAPGGNADVAHADGDGNLPVTNWPWGAGIASWVWSYCAKQSLIIQRNTTDPKKGDLFLTTCFTNNPNNLLNNGYIGTSQAAPHVAGLAALLIAENGRGNPAAIKNLIQNTGVPIDKSFGRSRIDVKKALGL
jgi:subtilisin family serine protease